MCSSRYVETGMASARADDDNPRILQLFYNAYRVVDCPLHNHWARRHLCGWCAPLCWSFPSGCCRCCWHGTLSFDLFCGLGCGAALWSELPNCCVALSAGAHERRPCHGPQALDLPRFLLGMRCLRRQASGGCFEMETLRTIVRLAENARFPTVMCAIRYANGRKK